MAPGGTVPKSGAALDLGNEQVCSFVSLQLLSESFFD